MLGPSRGCKINENGNMIRIQLFHLNLCRQSEISYPGHCSMINQFGIILHSTQSISTVYIDGAPIEKKNNENCWNFVQFLSNYKDIQGDIRHPVDYLVDLIETKVGVFQCGHPGESRWVIYTIDDLYDIYIQSMHIYAMKEFYRTSHPYSKKKQQLFFPHFIPLFKKWPPSGQDYRENTIDTMWLDGLIASKAITPSLGVNEAPASRWLVGGSHICGKIRGNFLWNIIYKWWES